MEEKHFGPVWFIPGEKKGKYPFCHSVYVEGARILIDPSSDRERLSQLRKDPGVDLVWLTHYHEDHLMHLDLFEDLPIWIAEQDAPPLADLECFLDAYGMVNEEHRHFWRELMKDQFHFRPRKPVGFLKDGDVFQFDAGSVEVIHTPGHTAGHLSFWFQEADVLFLGDYDLTAFGPWYGDKDSSIEDTEASIERLRNIPAQICLTCHETGIFEKPAAAVWDAYARIIAERESKLLALLDTPKTMEDIIWAWIVYGRPREPAALFEFGERAHMGKHLERLMGLGIVACEDGRYVKK
jgi:glyoxylase-like metal-dependent hydrolase (beta-lactamase superfamily II)